MNARLVNWISQNIKKAVEITEKKKPLQRELDEFLARPVGKYTTPEKYWDKEYSGIMKRMDALKLEKMQFESAAQAMKNQIHASLYPNVRQIMTQKAKDDIWILGNGLVFTPAELAHMRADYIGSSNPVMLRMIERYAKEHFPKSVKEFAFETEDAEKYIRAFDTLAQLANEAFEDAYGPAAAALEGFVSLATGEPDAEKFIEWANAEKE